MTRVKQNAATTGACLGVFIVGLLLLLGIGLSLDRRWQEQARVLDTEPRCAALATFYGGAYYLDGRTCHIKIGEYVTRVDL